VRVSSQRSGTMCWLFVLWLAGEDVGVCLIGSVLELAGRQGLPSLDPDFAVACLAKKAGLGYNPVKC